MISRAILTFNRDHSGIEADGVVITPSHNPPSNGGFKYNPPNGGPAGTEATRTIQDRANEILREGLKPVRRMPWEKALHADTTHFEDFIHPYIDDLRNVVNMDAIAASGLRIGVDPLGGAGVPLLGTAGRDVWVGYGRGEPCGGPHLPVHDRGF